VLEQRTLLTAYDESYSPDKAYQQSGIINIKNKISDPLVFATERSLDEENTKVNALFIDMANGSLARAELSGDDICDITPCFKGGADIEVLSHSISDAKSEVLWRFFY